jgi:hypothetical protein
LPAISTVHAVLDRHGLVTRGRHRLLSRFIHGRPFLPSPSFRFRFSR